MNYISSLFSENIIGALGWTLIHSVWQISLISIFLKIFLTLLKEKSAETRYGISVISLSIIIICSSITFSKYYFSEPESSITFDNILLDNSDIKKTSKLSDALSLNIKGENTSAWNYKFLSKINSNLNIIVGLWLLGMLFFSVRFAGGYWYVQRLRTRNISQPNNKLEIIVAGISKKLNIKKRIQIVESALVKIPVVIGFFKPIIILPVAMATLLPYDQVEAVLTHEIAHIKRKDYLINILKSILEVLYFYHPAFWWITSVIDAERENCCDDITIKVCGQVHSLQNALINLYENNQKPTYIAAALFKNKYQLLKRIKRMKTKNQSNINQKVIYHGFKGNLAGIAILVVGIIIFAGTSAFSPGQSEIPDFGQIHGILLPAINAGDNKPETTSSNSQVIEAKPLEINSGTLAVDKTPDSVKRSPANSGNINLEIDEDGNLVRITKNGKELQGEEKQKYEKLLSQAKDMEKEEYQMQKAQEEIERSKEQLKVAKEHMQKATEEYNKAMEFYVQSHGTTIDDNTIGIWSLAEEDYAKALMLSKFTQDNYRDAIWDFSEDWNEFEEYELMDKMEDFKWDINSDQFLDQYEDALRLKEIEMDLLQEQFDIQIDEFEDIKLLELEMEIFESRIREELVKDNLLKNKDDKLSFKISKKKLEVNGKKQSKTLHEKYLNLYESLYDEKLDDNKRIMIID